MTIYAYETSFFEYIEAGSRRSAKVMVDLLLRHLPIKSVLDVGCGQGVWLKEWKAQGVTDIFGMDGEYINPERLEIPKSSFKAADLTASFQLNRKFDLVQSLEVAEHIPEQYAERFVENLTRHGEIVLFSAAPPGQGGEFHINEQEYGYWRDIFLKYDYRLIDFIRPQLAHIKQVEPWYRYNSMLFVNGEKLSGLDQELQMFLKNPCEPVKDYAPLTWRIRRSILKRLPKSVVDLLVIIKHKAVLKLHQLQGQWSR